MFFLKIDKNIILDCFSHLQAFKAKSRGLMMKVRKRANTDCIVLIDIKWFVKWDITVLFRICQRESEYEQEMPQSHATDQPIVLWGRGKKRWQGNDIQKTIKVKQPALNQLSHLQCHDYYTRKDTLFRKTKEGPYTKHWRAMWLSINK